MQQAEARRPVIQRRTSTRSATAGTNSPSGLPHVLSVAAICGGVPFFKANDLATRSRRADSALASKLLTLTAEPSTPRGTFDEACSCPASRSADRHLHGVCGKRHPLRHFARRHPANDGAARSRRRCLSV